jgi:hypothetical protein
MVKASLAPEAPHAADSSLLLLLLLLLSLLLLLRPKLRFRRHSAGAQGLTLLLGLSVAASRYDNARNRSGGVMVVVTSANGGNENEA